MLRDVRLLSLALLAVLVVPACDDDDDGDDDCPSDPPPSSWLVGDDGEMHRVSDGGEVRGYPLHEDRDLEAIACVGEASAWVVGEAGLVLRSRDAGETWDELDVGVRTRLSALAVAGGAPEGDETVWIVGEAGAAVVSPDGGTSWSAIETDATVAYTGVATDEDGTFALATGGDGTIWRLADAEASLVHRADAPLHGIDMAHDGARAVAVGDDGTMLETLDGGASWAAMPVPTARDLFAVRVSGHGPKVLAVGDAGAFVRSDGAGATVVELLGPGEALLGLHMSAAGQGHAVGTRGTALRTDDFGAHWRALPRFTTRALHGVDDVHRGGHF